MRKPSQIRAVLEQANPHFVSNPSQLQIYVDHGEIISTGAESLSFEYRYSLNLIITDYAEDIARIIVPLLAYLRINQPEIFENPQRREGAFKFITDFNSHSTLDLSLEIQLTERVKAIAENEKVDINYLDEPTWAQVPETISVFLGKELIFSNKEQRNDEPGRSE